MFKNKVICLLLSLILILSLVGCDKTEDAYIYFELSETPSTLDPQTAKTETELLIVRNIFEGLMRKSSDGKIVNGVTESYEKNGLTYTFVIRENANWNNGDTVTADDFVFAFKRALDPKTKAPYASRLYAIKNAKSINKGKTSTQKLGVNAIDEKTLKITLDYEDPEFLEILTTPIAMPCNQNFFNESAGKYGLFRDNITSNGSYRLAKWNKESFGIRLYKNEEYTGEFKAKNAAVFLTCNNDEPITTKLKENKIDVAFIDTKDAANMEKEGFKTQEYENICWVMTISDDFSYDMRKAFMSLLGEKVYGNSLPNGYSTANSLFPNVFGKKISSKGITPYNLTEGKRLFSTEVRKLEDNKFPSDIVLYYYDNGAIKPVVTDIVGHWQSNLAAFINIEAATSAEVLLPELKKQNLSMAIFPVKADSVYLSEYLDDFGINYKNNKLSALQSEILESKNIFPIAFQNTTVCYSQAIKEIYTFPGDGYIDFSFIVKEE